MANYNVDIAIALKNSNKLTKLRKELKGATDNIRQFNKEASKQNKVAVSTFGKLNKQISRARSLLDKAAIGTSSFTRAAKVAVAVEKEMNLQLRQKEKLLAKIRAESVTSGQQTVIDRTARARQVKSGFAGFSARANQVTESAKIEAIKNKARDKHLKNIDNKVAKIATIQTQQQISRIPGGDTGVRFGVPGGKIGPALPRGFRLRQQFAPGGAFFNSKGTAGRISSGLQSGLIGGGFPLLFGQGGAGAIAGGLGGALGGALSPGFGFAGSIAATAITQQIQQTLEFRKSIRELNKEMEQMGISSNISGSQVRQLGKSLGITKEEAVKALQEFKRFGNDAVLIAKKFGGDFGKFDALTQANTVEAALSAIRKINKDLTLEEELRLVLSIQRRGVEATINDVVTDTLDKQKQLDTESFGQGVGGRKRAKVLEREREQTKEINTENAQLIEKFTTIKDLQDQIRIANEEASFSIVKGLQDVNSEIRRLNSAQFQVVELSKVLGTSFQESFKGIIRGTMSVGDAFRNMFMRIADHFLDMAAQMMAAQISRGFMGLFANAFGGGASSFLIPSTPLGIADSSQFLNSAPTLKFANGGRPPVGRASIVGERGPELFVPNSAGTIIPNHDLGGGTNIVVNVDASGSSVEGDEDEGRALGIALSAAIETELIKQKRPGGLLA